MIRRITWSRARRWGWRIGGEDWEWMASGYSTPWGAWIAYRRALGIARDWGMS